jgi:hypothetical protein
LSTLSKVHFLLHGSTVLVCLGVLVVEVSRLRWHTTLCRTPLDKGSARRRDLYTC